MSLPATSVPVAVLVLTWDETTPAVRALVEATEIADPMLDSIVVLVPAGPTTEELTQEEFLPLDTSLLPELIPPPSPVEAGLLPTPTAISRAAEPAEATPAPATTTDSAFPPVVAPATASLLPEALTTATAAGFTPPLPVLAGDQPTAPIATLPIPGLIGQETFAVPIGPTVRVLRLSEYSLAALAAYSRQALPAPTWVGEAAVPATPYLGSSAAASLPLSDLSSAAPAISTPFSTGASSPGVKAPVATEIAAQHAAPAPVIASASPTYPAAEQSVAPNAEADTTPIPASKEVISAAADAEESTTELGEEAADERTDSFTVDVTPVQAGWPEALASLRAPAAYAEVEQPNGTVGELVADMSIEVHPLVSQPASEPAAYAALLPATQRFDAPDLNFQIIQYARFAVPLALAAQPFGVIYAPAWPTWLAAQELRQRTGRPLVLHIAALAAQDEPLDLAAGWPAEIQRQALHRADLILTETPALAHRLRRELDLPAQQVRCVPAADAAAVAQSLSTAQVW